jgi:hypothetical protein
MSGSCGGNGVCTAKQVLNVPFADPHLQPENGHTAGTFFNWNGVSIPLHSQGAFQRILCVYVTLVTLLPTGAPW